MWLLLVISGSHPVMFLCRSVTPLCFCYVGQSPRRFCNVGQSTGRIFAMSIIHRSCFCYVGNAPGRVQCPSHIFYIINCNAKHETEDLQMDIHPGLGVLATGN